MIDKLRVFVSYAHDDREVVSHIVRALSDNGLEPIWDQQLQPGRGFDAEIMSYIETAHVFLPVLTPTSAARGWVHQEIGYARGLRIPTVPVCIDHAPTAMLKDLQAIVIDASTNFAEQFGVSIFDNHVGFDLARAHYACASLPGDRARMLAEYSQFVRRVGATGHVRQMGGLSSFHIPDKPITSPVWRARYGQFAKSEDHCTLLREERRALGEHARVKGCSLIVNPDLDFAPLGPGARSARVWELIQFLESMPDERIRVVFDRSLGARSVHIVGDWFLAESISADLGRGYRQTIFTRHAPTVRRRVQEFDELFDQLRRHPANKACASRSTVIRALKALPGVSKTPPFPA